MVEFKEARADEEIPGWYYRLCVSALQGRE